MVADVLNNAPEYPQYLQHDMSSLFRPRSLSLFPAYEPTILYFEVSLGVTAYVGRTNLTLSLVSSKHSFPLRRHHGRVSDVRTCRCCRPLSPHQGAPSHAPPGPSVSSPSRGPPRLAARGSGGCATTSSRARARWIACQHCYVILNPILAFFFLLLLSSLS